VGKYVGPSCRLCRAEGTKLFLKGKRCLSEKCAVSEGKRNYPPGQKGARANMRRSHYKSQLREKQKVKRYYGTGETQFRHVFAEAARRKGITGENLLQMLELRLDNVVYRMNLASSRTQARQLIRHGHLAVNGKKVNIPSYLMNLNDEISYRDKAKNNQNIKNVVENIANLQTIPGWLLVDHANLKGKINALPTRADVSLEVEERLIVELYSK
jgi:small subunit ribosomal protein S4